MKKIRVLLIIVLGICCILSFSNVVLATDNDTLDGFMDPVDGDNELSTGGNSTSGNNTSLNTTNTNTNLNTTNKSNTNSISTSNNVTTNNNATNRNASNTNTLANTGLSDFTGILSIAIVGCSILGIYSFKKVNEYKNF